MYENVYGTWNVTTEGDVEGRTTTDLGTHKGYVDEIAFHLAPRCYYALTFKKIEPIKKFKPKKRKVSIKFDIDSDTWDMSKNDLIDTMKNMFKDRPVYVYSANYFASFTLSLNKDVETKKEKMEKIKRKLTDDEFKFLSNNIA